MIIQKDIITKSNMTIPKGTEILILKEILNPNTSQTELIISINNGTGLKELFPRDLILKEDLDDNNANKKTSEVRISVKYSKKDGLEIERVLFIQ